MLKKITYQLKWVAVALALLVSGLKLPAGTASAANCPPLKIIFVRGSGETLNTGESYLEFRAQLAEKLNLVNIEHEFVDLDYPAVGVDKIAVLTGAYASGGESYEFGESVKDGIDKLTDAVNNHCPNTKYVLAGYSQGAMVVSGALKSLKSDKIIYAATFGDPKIYLPEGQGVVPAACRGLNLSEYRAYVPDCYAYEGILGSYRPYQPEAFTGKLGTWCNKYDVLCSSYFSINSHVSYVSDGLYEDASKMIFAKITSVFGIENEYVSSHDTAILIDSTGSMTGLIEKYKAEALRLARKTLESGGRVALYDYRDLNDPYQPVEHCNFTTCTLEKFEYELGTISIDGGGDTPESLLSSSYTMMKSLEWQYGSTKSVVVLTDAGYHSPDIDGKTFADVVALSKSIDPVNFYVITTDSVADEYVELVLATDGAVATTVDDLSVLTDTILARFDSLPRVEESDSLEEFPELTITEVRDDFGSEVTVGLDYTGSGVLVVLNDLVLGLANSDSITIGGLDRSVSNQLRLVPVSDIMRGEAVELTLGTILIPKTPDTGVIR